MRLPAHVFNTADVNLDIAGGSPAARAEHFGIIDIQQLNTQPAGSYRRAGQTIMSPKMAAPLYATGGCIMRQIQLTQNKIALLDDEDFIRLGHYHWCYRGERDGKLAYAIRHAKDEKKYRTTYLHREVVGEVPPDHEVIFKNHDRLDCRRENLAVVTTEDARRHHRARKDSRTGIAGIRFNPDGGTWSAHIIRGGHSSSIGGFTSKKEAIDAHRRRLLEENPDLHTAPEVIERQAEPEQAEGHQACRAKAA